MFVKGPTWQRAEHGFKPWVWFGKWAAETQNHTGGVVQHRVRHYKGPNIQVSCFWNPRSLFSSPVSMSYSYSLYFKHRAVHVNIGCDRCNCAVSRFITSSTRGSALAAQDKASFSQDDGFISLVHAQCLLKGGCADSMLTYFWKFSAGRAE